MSKVSRIAAVGDNCMDVYENIGEAYPGGNPVNVAVYTMRLGHSASYIGVVGTDCYGKRMIDSIQAKGVDISHVKIKEGNTAVTYVKLINGNRELGDYEEGVMAEFALTTEDIRFICEHDMLVTGIWGMIENELPRISEKGIPIAFDFATRWKSEKLNLMLPYVDYAFFSAEELTEEILDLMKAAKSKGPKIVIVTLGENGSIAYSGDEFIRYGIVPCEVKDTMGAGDSYIAGFITGILEGKTIYECMKQGALNSSITLQYMGAWG